jgi:hypothetical protein
MQLSISKLTDKNGIAKIIHWLYLRPAQYVSVIIKNPILF